MFPLYRHANIFSGVNQLLKLIVITDYKLFHSSFKATDIYFLSGGGDNETFSF